MIDKKFQTIIDCGFSKIRAGAFNKEGKNDPFFVESNFYIDQLNFQLEIQKIIASLEKATAVGPENKLERSLHFVFWSASFVILFLVI